MRRHVKAKLDAAAQSHEHAMPGRCARRKLPREWDPRSALSSSSTQPLRKRSGMADAGDTLTTSIEIAPSWRSWSGVHGGFLVARASAAIARAALREPNLPRAEHTHASREVKLLVDHREDLVNTRTRLTNRIRWYLHELDPQLDPPSRGLDRSVELDRLEQELDAMVDSMVRRRAIELLADIRQLTVRANVLEKELAALVRRHAPQLLELPGCGALTAAKLIGETKSSSVRRGDGRAVVLNSGIWLTHSQIDQVVDAERCSEWGLMTC